MAQQTSPHSHRSATSATVDMATDTSSPPPQRTLSQQEYRDALDLTAIHSRDARVRALTAGLTSGRGQENTRRGRDDRSRSDDSRRDDSRGDDGRRRSDDSSVQQQQQQQSPNNRQLAGEEMPRRQSSASQQSRGAGSSFGVTFQEPLECECLSDIV